METAISRDGTRLAYDVYGSGPPLVYITGASCFRTFWPVVQDAKAFAKSFTIYNYDRRGRGDSTDTQPYAVEREVEDVEAIVDAAGGRASLFGHSSGAVLALEAALRLGDKVDGAVLYDPSYVSDETEKAAYEILSQQVHALLRVGDNGKAMRTFLSGIGMPKVFVHLMRFMPGWRRMTALAPSLAYDIALTCDLPPIERASRVTVPVQIVAGEKSPSSVRETARQLAEAIPESTFLELAGQDHMASAKAVLPVLTGFLKDGTSAP